MEWEKTKSLTFENIWMCRTKLDSKSEKYIFIGYAIEQKGYRCYKPITNYVKVSRDVVFDELLPWYGESKYVQEEVE